MAFISYEYTIENSATKLRNFILTDSEFGSVEIEESRSAGAGAHAVAKEYTKRGLPVGRNLALLVLYQHKKFGDPIDNLICYQDRYCPRYVDNWATYAKERDEHLTKLLPLL